MNSSTVNSSYNFPYHQTLVYKLMNATKPGNLHITFEQSLDIIRRVHDFSRGLPQIVYLTGWQYDGHDSKYPAWHEVNPRLKREQDATAHESMLWLMREAKKFNATISVHINVDDAYQSSPLWDEYVEKDMLRREPDGSFSKGDIWGGEQSYQISKTREWNAGLMQKRIEELLELLPLREQGTVHLDVFDKRPSLYHRITDEQEYETLRNIVLYWRERGIDVTSEWFKPQLAGLIPMVWHYNLDERMRLKYPVDVVCGGGDAWNVRHHGWPNNWTWFPENGCAYEEAWGRSIDREPYLEGDEFSVFEEAFFLRTLPWLFLNRQRIVQHVHTAESYEVHFTDEVKTSVRVTDRHLQLTWGTQVLVDGTDVFLPASWSGNQWMAFSKDGCERSWPLPPEWQGATQVQAQTVVGNSSTEATVHGDTLHLHLQPGQAVVVVPQKINAQ
jgi:hypothetical protein